jgi:hypothetical protein
VLVMGFDMLARLCCKAQHFGNVEIGKIGDRLWVIQLPRAEPGETKAIRCSFSLESGPTETSITAIMARWRAM